MKFRIVQIYPESIKLKYQLQEEYDKPSLELKIEYPHKPVSYSKDWRPLLMYSKDSQHLPAKAIPSEYASIKECEYAIEFRVNQLKQLNEIKEFKPITVKEYEY